MSANERIVGRAIRIGDNVDTDVMIPGAYLNMTDPQSLGEHLFETYDESVARRVGPGDIIVAGRNCGMGSSRSTRSLRCVAVAYRQSSASRSHGSSSATASTSGCR